MIKKTIESWIQYYREHQHIVIDTLILILAITCTGFYLSYIEATEAFYEYSRNHEDLELDDIALTVAVSAIYISIYTLRRFFDLKNMMYMAYTDPLMGVTNRRRGTTLIENEINKSKRHNNISSIIMFDLDNFKQINDVYGHSKGDYVLQEICRIILKEIRGCDEFIRWGGEEFIVLCPCSNLEQTSNLGERLRASIAKHNFKDLMRVTASFGVAEIKQREELDNLLNRVDQRLYESKNSGKNKVTSS